MNKLIFSKLSNLIKNSFSDMSMKDMFLQDSLRFSKYSIKTCDILLDYSKNLINDEIFSELIAIAEESKISKYRKDMFDGKKINFTEDRAVLHTALRSAQDKKIIVDGVNIYSDIAKERTKVADFVNSVHNHEWLGYSNKAITDIVNIGIGGSDLGPKMVVEALKPYHLKKTQVHFISNVDAGPIIETLELLNPETTLFIICSKTFGTQETLMNANTAKKWVIDFYKNENCIKKHFIAVSVSLEAVEKFGIDLKNCYKMWDWVGGRYSLWSSIGIAISFAIGNDNFNSLLEGASDMDHHFCTASYDKNIPVILALLGILYRNIYGSQSQGILAYDERLKYLVSYLQQADMESNGKSVGYDNKKLSFSSGAVVWGGIGTNGQHAFHQLLHQGTDIIPVDFIACCKSHHNLQDHHDVLLANCLAQSQALMHGQQINENSINNDAISLHRFIPGNKPSNTLLLDSLTPKVLGSLIALYEHKIFVQGIIWGINSFDQWGVELGKKLTNPILHALNNNDNASEFDSSTSGLIKEINLKH